MAKAVIHEMPLLIGGKDFLQRFLCNPPGPHLALDDPVQAATGHSTKGRFQSFWNPSHIHPHLPPICAFNVTLLDLALCTIQTPGMLIPLPRFIPRPIPGIPFQHTTYSTHVLCFPSVPLARI